VRSWPLRVLLINVIQVCVVMLAGVTWERWLSSQSLLGLSPQAGAIYTFRTAVGEFFYHSNVKTPRWVGVFFQRPEMHRIHHQYGRHKNNYGDITWSDMMFGTYENPIEWRHTCGFDEEKEQQLLKMLRYRDVQKSEPES
jgi:sterol desaturase/sphingolipid hydroxylase (fatty acid hydroxylase superfamily)